MRNIVATLVLLVCAQAGNHKDKCISAWRTEATTPGFRDRFERLNPNFDYSSSSLVHAVIMGIENETEGELGERKEAILYLLGKGANIDAHDDEERGQTALHAAARGCGLLEFLLEKKANMEEKDKYGLTPLLSAASAGIIANVETLLKAGANPLAVSNSGDSGLHLAAYGGGKNFDKVVAVFRRYGNDSAFTLKNKNGRTADFINSYENY